VAEQQIDALSRALVALPSRRHFVRLAGAFALGGWFTGMGTDATTAKKGKGKKGKRKSRGGRSQPPSGTCAVACGTCQTCQGSSCVPQPNGIGCGTCKHCLDGACRDCGFSGQHDCREGVCELCGGLGQPCCAGTTCQAGLGCTFGAVPADRVCTNQCGGLGDPCCGGSCGPTFFCCPNPAPGMCVENSGQC
jgi:hypothetical protein